MYCIVLYCIIIILYYCIVLYCIALHCTALHCIALHCTALHCIALHCIALHCIALHCIALHCIALYYIILYYIILYYIILYYIILSWDHCRISGPSLTETSLCDAYLYSVLPPFTDSFTFREAGECSAVEESAPLQNPEFQQCLNNSLSLNHVTTHTIPGLTITINLL